MTTRRQRACRLNPKVRHDIYRPLTITVQRKNGRKIRVPMEWVQTDNRLETVQPVAVVEMEARMRRLKDRDV